MQKSIPFYSAIIGGAIIFFSFGLLIGAQQVPPNAARKAQENRTEQCVAIPAFVDNKSVDFKLFWNVWESLENRFYKQPLSQEKLFYGAVKGMTAATGDPYTVFFDPTSAAEFNRELEGKFEGIGAEIAIKHDRLTVVSPLAESPAERAGLRPGDVILAIDKVDTATLSLEDAVSRIRGPKGTTVVLTILTKGVSETKDAQVKREEIIVKTVQWEIVAGNVAYVRIFSFNEDTIDDFKTTVSAVIKKNSSGIILDLRSNPGGYLDSAVKMASYWIPEGVIVEERFSDGAKDSYKAVGQARLEDQKTVVLVNEGSASASEIVAGALQDYGKATIVGEQTFGKGSVQDYSSLEGGSALKITIAEWLTPKGNSINEIGIKPDIVVPMSVEDVNNDMDPQLERAIELLR